MAEVGAEGVVFTVETKGERASVQLKMLGRHNVSNALAAIARNRNGPNIHAILLLVAIMRRDETYETPLGIRAGLNKDVILDPSVLPLASGASHFMIGTTNPDGSWMAEDGELLFDTAVKFAVILVAAAGGQDGAVRELLQELDESGKVVGFAKEW